MLCQEHNKKYCRECDFGYCPHSRVKYNCRECGGGSFCEHGKRKQICRDCGGSSFCGHGKRKLRCRDCGGGSFCGHGKHKYACKECNDPIPITIGNMIKGAKQTDKRHNRYDLLNFVDTDFLKNLIEDAEGKCCYCECVLQYRQYQSNLGTLERIDNTLGHIKTNCKIACFHCNVSKVGQV